MTAHKRRTIAKGKWMKLRDPAILEAFIKSRPGMNQNKLGEYAGCSRQFIGQLLKPRDDPSSKKGCTPKLAEAIEGVLGAPKGSIFVASDAIESVKPTPSHRKPRPAGDHAKAPKTLQAKRPAAGKLRIA